jgi:spore coat polysaccharide biosynthesis protein SpsF
MANLFRSARASSVPCDLATNARVRTFPRGLDAEIFTRDSLEIMLSSALEPRHWEHVTPFLYEHPERFRILDHLCGHGDLSGHRWTIDTADDYALLTQIFSASAHPERLRLPDVIALLDANPEWMRLNAHVAQKAIL